MRTLAIILLVILIGYCLFIAFGVILICLSSPEEKKQIRKEMKEMKLKKELERNARKRRPKWYDYPSPGITDP